MTDRTEREYTEDVALYLYEHFGSDRVNSTEYLHKSGTFPDYWITGPICDYAVEVENGADSLYEGVGQALYYAAHAPTKTVPVVVFPKDHLSDVDCSLLDLIPVYTLEL